MHNGISVGDSRPEAPVGADRILSGRLAKHLEHQPLLKKEARLGAEVLQLRAEATALCGDIEKRN